MGEQKVKFTVWFDPAVLQAAKTRAGRTGKSMSEVLADAARDSLVGRSGDNGTGDILKAVDRVFYQVQRAERRRAFDYDVLKEMLGLAVLSFFNHTPAVPETEKRAALVSGKMRFGRFLDTLAQNLRGGRSILHDLPATPDGASPQNTTVAARPDKTTDGAKSEISPIAPGDPATNGTTADGVADLPDASGTPAPSL